MLAYTKANANLLDVCSCLGPVMLAIHLLLQVLSVPNKGQFGVRKCVKGAAVTLSHRVTDKGNAACALASNVGLQSFRGCDLRSVCWQASRPSFVVGNFVRMCAKARGYAYQIKIHRSRWRLCVPSCSPLPPSDRRRPTDYHRCSNRHPPIGHP